MSENERTELTSLRDAIEAEQLGLRFEPVVRGSNLEILGLEGRPVWRRDDGTEIGPGEITEIAEEAGLMPQIGSWTVRAAARQLVDWENAGLVHDLVLHVRSSGSELIDPDYAGMVAHELEAAGLRASKLYVEVSLADVVDAGKAGDRTLGQLRRLGCRLVLTGFDQNTPLDAIVRHEFEAVKLEPELLAEGDESKSLLRGVMQIARVLGVTTLVTGLDAQEDLERAAENGLAFVQGPALAMGESGYDLASRPPR